MKRFSNQEISELLSEMGELYEAQGVQFKPRAFDRASSNIMSLEEQLADLYAKGGEKVLMSVPGVGKGIAAHIAELFEKGKIVELEILKKSGPKELHEIASVEGVGPKTAMNLWKLLGISSVQELEQAAQAGKIRSLKGFGVKSEERILEGVSFLKESNGRRTLGEAYEIAEELLGYIHKFPEIQCAEVAGSIRRMKETIGDIDLLAVSADPKNTADAFASLPFVVHVYDKGTKKVNVRLKNGMDADLRFVPQESWGAALLYFTGSKAHNVAMRQLAIKKGMKLNKYGLFKGEKMVAGATEEEVYSALGLRYIPPEMREMTGEMELALRGAPIRLVSLKDLKGDLQVQTDWTDGADSIEDMAKAAEEAGLEYIVITDHTKSLAMTRGSDEKRLKEQIKEIARIQKKMKKIRILSGAEVNILKDGSLDIDDATLALLDVVGASVHSHFNLSKEEQTARVILAMENPNVDILFHPTGRLVNKRKPIELDMEIVMDTAKRTGTVLEINAFPVRLDLKDEYIRMCVDKGVYMAIDSDAHAKEHYSVLKFGVGQARRGWATKELIVNTLPAEQMLLRLKKG